MSIDINVEALLFTWSEGTFCRVDGGRDAVTRCRPFKSADMVLCELQGDDAGVEVIANLVTGCACWQRSRGDR